MITNSIFTYFLIIIFSPLIGKLIKCIIDYYKTYKNYKSSITLIDSLDNITQREFEIWCSEYLSYLDFSNIVLLPLNSNCIENIIGYKDSIKYYIYCKNSTSIDLITLTEIEAFLGTMINDDITHGLIITTSSISEETCEFLKNLKVPYKIDLISSKELSLLPENYILKTN